MTDKIDEYTKRLVGLALEIATAALENGKDYFIGGGFAIEFSLGRITRNHHDIDFHPMLKDVLWWKKWFEDHGYKVKNKIDKKFTEVFKIINKDGGEVVDMWPLKLEGAILLIMYQGKYVDSGRHWEEVRTARYRDVDIKIENPERVLEQKVRHVKQLGQKFRSQDLHDFKVLGKRPKLN